jgi:ABC-type polysaccharide/polyol phosphate transport system ATPase subunit
VQPILEVNNLNLVLKVPQYRGSSLRDGFVNFMKSPFDSNLNINRFHVLKDISFSLQKGDRLAILGRNGAGKSTLCRCLAGFYQPSTGKIVRNARLRAFFDTQMGIVPELTGRENAKLLLSFIFPELSQEHETILEEAISFSELKGFADAPYRTYSNGMATRLCLSVITARPSQVLILDEVFDGADRFFQEKMKRRMLHAIHSSDAVIFISHSEDQVKAVANRALVLHESKIIYDGEVEEANAVFCDTSNVMDL